MQNFAIVETDDGLTIIEIPADKTAEVAALEFAADLIDPGPYASYDEAQDVLENLQLDDTEERM